jgi:hypothetical protein
MDGRLVALRPADDSQISRWGNGLHASWKKRHTAAAAGDVEVESKESSIARFFLYGQ